MLSIKEIICVAAVGVAPMVLFGCAEGKQAESGTGTQSGSDRSQSASDRASLDKNGFARTDAESAIAIGALLGDCLNVNECDDTARDADLIKRALKAVVEHGKKETGDAAAVDKALADWKFGDAVPEWASAAVVDICPGGDSSAKGIIDLSIWDQANRDAVTANVAAPAVKEITKVARKALKAAGFDHSDAAVGAAIKDIGYRIDRQFGEGTFADTAANWNCGRGDGVPEPVGEALQEHLAYLGGRPNLKTAHFNDNM